MLKLDAGRHIRLARGRHCRVLCLEGTLWITLAGDPRDRFLSAGASLILDGSSLAWVEAWEAATLVIEAPPSARRALRLPRWLWAGHAPCRKAPE